MEQIHDKGKLEGKLEGKIEIAKGMLSKGMSVSLISEITGLSEEEILRLS
jgi:predicted transposase/invertase (TIGR01784 family)